MRRFLSRFLSVSMTLALFILVVCTPMLVEAYEVTEPVFDAPYAIVSISGDPEREQVILGELSNAPEMYEIKSDNEFILTAELRTLPGLSKENKIPDLSGIIVRQNDSLGVAEVGRLKATDATWSPVFDGTTGLTYVSGPFFSQTVPAGTYHIEVSTPANSGKYMLVLGNTPLKTGYFDTLNNIGVVYDFYRISHLHMFSSPYVHYPLGIGFLLILIAGTWYWQRNRTRHG